MNIAEYNKQRNKALLSLDKQELQRLAKENNTKIPEDEKVFWAGVHYARLNITSFSEEVKQVSHDWLIDNGFNPSY